MAARENEANDSWVVYVRLSDGNGLALRSYDDWPLPTAESAPAV